VLRWRSALGDIHALLRFIDHPAQYHDVLP
jgi:hypothetical protein